MFTSLFSQPVTFFTVSMLFGGVMSSIPTVQLNNGLHMPVHGLGTFLTEESVSRNSTETALRLGYRHIDTADIYQNHRGVGAGIKTAFDEGLLTRDELFVTTKLWMSDYHPELVEPAVRRMLEELQLEYVDQLLLHWPSVFEKRDSSDPDRIMPRDSNGNVVVDPNVKLSDTWKEMEKVYDLGLAKSIGVSNFREEDLTNILKESRIKPAVNQIEVHPYLPQDSMRAFCESHGIHIVAYAPLGNPAFKPHDGKENLNLLQSPAIVRIAEEVGKTPAQVLIRWSLQKKNIVIPKSVKAPRIKENFNVFDFELSSAHMESIKKLGVENRQRVFNPLFAGNGKTIFGDEEKASREDL